MNLRGKITLITGANRGIGLAIAKILANKGATVIGTATNDNGVAIINNTLKQHGIGYVMNITDNQSIANTLTTINKNFGDINILINNAGIVDDHILIRMKEEEWNKVINTNLNSMFRITKPIVRTMIKNRYGRIISISSVVAKTGNIGQSNYSAAKAGIIAFSKSLAREVATYGITVNIVAPGFIKTDMTKSLTHEQQIAILANIPMGRQGDPKEIANAVAFLASDESSYITGATLHVNGGMCMI
uniref:3-oxoacyl-[acyl-carrier-protein] reductase n=1 Tax=Candidatus Aschnera chinzeii TaxID=1485666 RepID=A0AAT9G3S9_9ENTR|nr:MAG: 3-oxoacyl-ACP reductase FabG [Candidatus Aschnera chinzeii]